MQQQQRWTHALWRFLLFQSLCAANIITVDNVGGNCADTLCGSACACADLAAALAAIKGGGADSVVVATDLNVGDRGLALYDENKAKLPSEIKGNPPYPTLFNYTQPVLRYNPISAYNPGHSLTIRYLKFRDGAATAIHIVFLNEIVFIEDVVAAGGRSGAAANGGFLLHDCDGQQCEAAELHLVRASVANTTADWSGGAVWARHLRSVVVQDSRFTANVADTGGALWLGALRGDAAVLSNVSFTANHATFVGGAVFARDVADLLLNDVSFEGNLALDDGIDLHILLSSDNETSIIALDSVVHISSKSESDAHTLITVDKFAQSQIELVLNAGVQLCSAAEPPAVAVDSSFYPIELIVNSGAQVGTVGFRVNASHGSCGVACVGCPHAAAPTAASPTPPSPPTSVTATTTTAATGNPTASPTPAIEQAIPDEVPAAAPGMASPQPPATATLVLLSLLVALACAALIFAAACVVRRRRHAVAAGGGGGGGAAQRRSRRASTASGGHAAPRSVSNDAARLGGGGGGDSGSRRRSRSYSEKERGKRKSLNPLAATPTSTGSRSTNYSAIQVFGLEGDYALNLNVAKPGASVDNSNYKHHVYDMMPDELLNSSTSDYTLNLAAEHSGGDSEKNRVYDLAPDEPGNVSDYKTLTLTGGGGSNRGVPGSGVGDGSGYVEIQGLNSSGDSSSLPYAAGTLPRSIPSDSVAQLRRDNYVYDILKSTASSSAAASSSSQSQTPGVAPFVGAYASTEQATRAESPGDIRREKVGYGKSPGNAGVYDKHKLFH